MYNLDIFECTDIPLDWCTIYYGIKNNFLDKAVASQYVIKKLENDEEVSQGELELSWGMDNKQDILEKIEEIPNIGLNEERLLKVAQNRIRIAILIYLRKNVKGTEALMQKVEMVYADFDYPSDMENFILYMPVADNYIPAEHTKEENENRLLVKLDSFINEELEKIKKI